jgi:hypothetical protein
LDEIKKVKFLKNFTEFPVLLVNFITNSYCFAARQVMTLGGISGIIAVVCFRNYYKGARLHIKLHI